MTNAVIKTRNRSFAEPVLRKVLREASKEHRNLTEAFKLLGWSQLPDELKMAIKDDILAYMNELEGNYSTCDPFVVKRRKSVFFWVQSYLNGICSLETAIKTLKITPL